MYISVRMETCLHILYTHMYIYLLYLFKVTSYSFIGMDHFTDKPVNWKALILYYYFYGKFLKAI